MKATVLACVFLSAVAVPQPAPPLIVAAATGIGLLPIAHFDGQAFVNSWPGPDDDRAPFPPLDSIPASWLGADVPRAWTIWSGAGATRVQVTGTRRGGGCEDPILLTVSKPNDALRGVAVNNDQRFEAISTVDVSGTEASTLRPTIDEAFRAGQSALLARLYPRIAVGENPQLTENRAATERVLSQSVLKISSLDRVDEPNGHSYFYVAEKADRSERRGEAGGSGLRIAGWIATTSSRQVSSVRIADEQLGGFPGDGWHLLGVFRHMQREYWVVHHTQYEGSEFVLYSVNPPGAARVLAVSGGGC